jgi:Zn-dependent protease
VKQSLRLFEVGGVEVRVHITFPLLLAWAAYYWGMRAQDALTGALFGIAVTLLLFAAVTLHELGHSMQAKRFGVQVRDITLLPFGGMARMEQIPESPQEELRIAVAGPLVNLAIAVVLIAFALLLDVRGVLTVNELLRAMGDTSWAGMLLYLIMANLSVAVFNLIPAFPMDGGRVLRALLATRMDYVRATRIAAAVGQGFAWLFGFWSVAVGQWTLTLIAVFIWMGAAGEARTVEVRRVLRGAKVREAMSREPLAVHPSDQLRRAVDVVLSASQADLPVVANGRVVGVLTRDDLLAGLRGAGPDATVGSAMHAQFPSVGPDDGIEDAHTRMAATSIRAVPVVEHERLTGLLTSEDISEWYGLSVAAQAGRRRSALMVQR